MNCALKCGVTCVVCGGLECVWRVASDVLHVLNVWRVCCVLLRLRRVVYCVLHELCCVFRANALFCVCVLSAACKIIIMRSQF